MVPYKSITYKRTLKTINAPFQPSTQHLPFDGEGEKEIVSGTHVPPSRPLPLYMPFKGVMVVVTMNRRHEHSYQRPPCNYRGLVMDLATYPQPTFLHTIAYYCVPCFMMLCFISNIGIYNRNKPDELYVERGRGEVVHVDMYGHFTTIRTPTCSFNTLNAYNRYFIDMSIPAKVQETLSVSMQSLDLESKYFILFTLFLSLCQIVVCTISNTRFLHNGTRGGYTGRQKALFHHYLCKFNISARNSFYPITEHHVLFMIVRNVTTRVRPYFAPELLELDCDRYLVPDSACEPINNVQISHNHGFLARVLYHYAMFIIAIVFEIVAVMFNATILATAENSCTHFSVEEEEVEMEDQTEVVKEELAIEEWVDVTKEEEEVLLDDVDDVVKVTNTPTQRLPTQPLFNNGEGCGAVVGTQLVPPQPPSLQSPTDGEVKAEAVSGATPPQPPTQQSPFNGEVAKGDVGGAHTHTSRSPPPHAPLEGEARVGTVDVTHPSPTSTPTTADLQRGEGEEGDNQPPWDSAKQQPSSIDGAALRSNKRKKLVKVPLDQLSKEEADRIREKRRRREWRKKENRRARKAQADGPPVDLTSEAPDSSVDQNSTFTSPPSKLRRTGVPTASTPVGQGDLEHESHSGGPPPPEFVDPALITLAGTSNQPTNGGGLDNQERGGQSAQQNPQPTPTEIVDQSTILPPPGDSIVGGGDTLKQGGKGVNTLHTSHRQPYSHTGGGPSGTGKSRGGTKPGGRGKGPVKARPAGGVRDKGEPKFTLTFTKEGAGGEEMVGEVHRVLFRTSEHFTVSRVRPAGPHRAQLGAHDEESARVVSEALRSSGFVVNPPEPVWTRYTFEVPGALSSLPHNDIVEGLLARNRFGGFPEGGLRYVNHTRRTEEDLGRGRGRGRGRGAARRAIRVGDIDRMFVDVSPAGVLWLKERHGFMSTGPAWIVLFPAGDRRPAAQ